MLNKFNIRIGSQRVSSEVIYPITIKRKNLNDMLDELEFTIVNRDKEPMQNFQRVEVDIRNGEDVNQDYFYGMLAADQVERIGASDLYKHNISVIEYAWILQNYLMPNITITLNTNPEKESDRYEPTLAEVFDRIMDVAYVEFPDMDRISLTKDTRDKLNSLKSIEWTFERETLYEIIQKIFHQYGINPKFKNFMELSHVEPLDISAGDDKSESFVNTNITYNPQTMISTLSTDIKNMELEGTVIEPQNNYNPLSSTDGFEVSVDNIFIDTTYPISHVKKLVLNTHMLGYAYANVYNNNTVVKVLVSRWIPAGVVPDYMKNNNILRTDDGGLPDALVEKSYYDTLPATEDGIGSKFYFETGKPGIHGLSVLPKYKSFWGKRKTALYTVLNADSGENFHVPFTTSQWIMRRREPFLPEYKEEAEKLVAKYIEDNYTAPAGETVGNMIFLAANYYPMDVRSRVAGRYAEREFGYNSMGQGDGQFLTVESSSYIIEDHIASVRSQVEYVPYLNPKNYTYRERNTKVSDFVSYQNYNQTTNITSNTPISRLLDDVSKSNSGYEMNQTYMITKMSDYLPIGSKYKDFLITGSVETWNKNSIDIIYSFDEYYKRLNHYIAMREKWRQFEIPDENVLDRQMTINRFAKISYAAKKSSDGFNVKKYLSKGSEKMNSLFLSGRGYSSDYDSTFALFGPSMAIANSISMVAGLKSNNVVGNTKLSLEISNNAVKKRQERPVRLRNNFEAKLQFGYLRDEVYDSYHLPFADMNKSIINKDAFYTVNSININQDLRERLLWSFQLHHVDETDDVFLNNGFSRENGLTGGAGLNEGLFKVLTNLDLWQTKFISKANILKKENAIFTLHDESIAIPVMRANSAAKTMAIVKDLGNGTFEVLLSQRVNLAAGQTSKQLYINFSDEYLYQQELKEYQWERIYYTPAIVDYDVSEFILLPKPEFKNLYGRVRKFEFIETNKRHEADFGYIVSEEPFPSTRDWGKKGVATGFELYTDPSFDAEMENDRRFAWERTIPFTSEPDYIVRDYNDLPDPKNTREFAIVENSEWVSAGRNYDDATEFVENYDDLPVRNNLGHKVIETKHRLIPISHNEWEAGTYMDWRSVVGPITRPTHTVNEYDELPEAKYLETAKVINPSWKQDNNAGLTTDYLYFPREELPILQDAGHVATITGFDLKQVGAAEWTRPLKWATTSVQSNTNFWVNHLSELSAPTFDNSTARVDNLTYQRVGYHNDVAVQNIFEDEWEMEKYVDKWSDAPRNAVRTNTYLKTASSWDYNNARYKIELFTDSRDTKDVWYAMMKQERQYFDDLGQAVWLGLIIRVDTGYGYDYYRLESNNPSSEDAEYFTGTKDIKYYRAITDGIHERMILEVSDYPTNNDIWYAFERQENQKFNDLSQAHARNMVIRVDDVVNFGSLYYVLEPAGEEFKKFVSQTNVRYYEATSYSKGTRISIGNEIHNVPTDNDVYYAWLTQEKQYFEEMSRFAAVGGLIKYDSGYGNSYYRVEGTYEGADEDPETWIVDSYTKHFYKVRVYYVGEKRFITRDMISENPNDQDIWFALQKYFKQDFDELDRLEHANGIISVDTGFSTDNYKLRAVGSMQYNRYFISDVSIEEYYISIEKK